MENYQKTVRVHRILSFLYGLIALLFVCLLFVGSAKVRLMYVFLFGIFGGFFALHHFTARAALQRKPWARIVSIIMGIILLFGFPVGTIIGVLLLLYARKPWLVENA